MAAELSTTTSLPGGTWKWSPSVVVTVVAILRKLMPQLQCVDDLLVVVVVVVIVRPVARSVSVFMGAFCAAACASVIVGTCAVLDPGVVFVGSLPPYAESADGTLRLLTVALLSSGCCSSWITSSFGFFELKGLESLNLDFFSFALSAVAGAMFNCT